MREFASFQKTYTLRFFKLGALRAFEDKKNKKKRQVPGGGWVGLERVSHEFLLLFVCLFSTCWAFKEELPGSSVTAESSWYRARIQVRVFPIFHFPLLRARSPLPIAR